MSTAEVIQSNRSETLVDRVRSAEQLLTSHFKEKLGVNTDLDRTLVSFQANRNANGHRWHKYREGFSAALMGYVFDKAGISGGRLLDPFAGSGTALFCAQDMGMDAVGIELLPSAAEIISVRNLLVHADPFHIAKQLRKIKDLRSWEAGGPVIPFPHVRITKGAFSADTERAIGRYLHDLILVEDELVRRVLRFACMCILEAVSYTRKDGQYLRWDHRSGRCAGKPFNKGPISGFGKAISEKLEEIATDLNSPNKDSLFPERRSTTPGKIELLLGSCLNLLPRSRLTPLTPS